MPDDVVYTGGSRGRGGRSERDSQSHKDQPDGASHEDQHHVYALHPARCRGVTAASARRDQTSTTYYATLTTRPVANARRVRVA